MAQSICCVRDLHFPVRFKLNNSCCRQQDSLFSQQQVGYFTEPFLCPLLVPCVVVPLSPSTIFDFQFLSNILRAQSIMTPHNDFGGRPYKRPLWINIKMSLTCVKWKVFHQMQLSLCSFFSLIFQTHNRCLPWGSHRDYVDITWYYCLSLALPIATVIGSSVPSHCAFGASRTVSAVLWKRWSLYNLFSPVVLPSKHYLLFDFIHCKNVSPSKKWKVWNSSWLIKWFGGARAA